MAQGVSFEGINWVAFGITDDKGLLIPDALGDKGVLTVDGDGEGATTANITGLEEKGTAQYANNQVKRMAHGAQTPVVALTMLDMAFEPMQKMKGYFSDGKGGWVLNTGSKPNVAMMICSSDFDGNKFYDCFARGEMIEVAHNHGTNTNSEVDYNGTFEYDALDPIKEDIFLDEKGVQRSYKQYYSGDKGFDEAAMYAEVFGGFKLDGSDDANNGDDSGK